MEKSQSDLCRQVLHRLAGRGLLSQLMLIGSWCLLSYEDYFRGASYHPDIRTRDLDLLIPRPLRLVRKTDLFALLEDLGFVLDFKGEGGWITFQHPELILEFLVPERGGGTNQPVAVPALGINAQALRFLDLLLADPVQLRFQGVLVTVPHPATFALHKLIIAARRKNDKGERDRAQAVQLLHTLVEAGETETIRQRLEGLPKRWQTHIRKALVALHEERLLKACF